MLGYEVRSQIELRARHMRARMLWWMARRLLRAVRRHRSRLEGSWQQDAAREQLRNLSDRMLRDVGLHRSEIDGLFRRA